MSNIVYDGKNVYLVNEEDIDKVEQGANVFDLSDKSMNIVLGDVVSLNEEEVVETPEEEAPIEEEVVETPVEEESTTETTEETETI